MRFARDRAFRPNTLQLPLWLIVAALINACDAVSERNCGVFSHPELELWQPDNLPTSVQFISEGGLIENFTRSVISRNEPFLGSDGASNDEDVLCLLSATQRLDSTSSDLAIVTRFVQEERLVIPDDEEVLLIEHTLESPVGDRRFGAFIADISVQATRVNFNSSLIEYAETAEINGVVYEDVISITITDPTPNAVNPDGDAFDIIQRIRFARIHGIVAYTDASGREFLRVSS